MKKYALILVLGLIGVGLVANRNPNDKHFEIVKNLDIFAGIYKLVNAYYVDDSSPTKLIETGIEAMLASLDPYTNYIPEDQIEDYRTMTTGEYGGVGASVTQIGKKIVVAMPFEGYAAHKAGLKAGDQIVEIDGINVENKSYEQSTQLLKGQISTKVKIKVRRFGEKNLLEFDLKREKISISSVPFFGMVSPEVGLIKLTEFTHHASREVKTALQQLKQSGAKKIILDLRGNPGGLLMEAINISNIFIPQGSEVVKTKGRVAEWNETYQALNPAVDTDIQLAVLISGTSASASEIVAGVIQDYDRGIIIGQNSYGKGLVQSTKPLSYNSKLKITVAKYYVPSGRCIQEIDYSHRSEDGAALKIPDSLRAIFYTKNGRPVYDGGGVKPDIELEAEKKAPILQALENHGLIFDYATEYHFKNAKIDSAKVFALSDAAYQQFVTWVQNRQNEYKVNLEIQLDVLEKEAQKEAYFGTIKSQIEALKQKITQSKTSDFQTHKNTIKAALEKEIVGRYFLEKGSIEANFDHDPEVAKALELLSNSQKYTAILSKK